MTCNKKKNADVSVNLKKFQKRFPSQTKNKPNLFPERWVDVLFPITPAKYN